MKKRIIIFAMSLFVLFTAAAQSTRSYNRFVDNVKKELEEINIKNYEDHFDEQYFIIKEENEYFDVGTEVGVSNLYSVCVQSGRVQWEKTIKAFFSQVKKIRAEEKEIISKLEDFETGKEYLKIRIYPIDYKDKISGTSIFESIVDDSISVVVIDFPSAVKFLSTEYEKKWGVDSKEIFEVAKENTLKNNTEEFEDFEISKNFSVSVMFSETNIFITSSIYDLNKKCKSISGYGALVALPNRYGIILKNIEKESINSDIVEMMMLVNYTYQQGPGSISNSIYWFDGKNFYKVLHDQSQEIIKFPDELINVLK